MLFIRNYIGNTLYYMLRHCLKNVYIRNKVKVIFNERSEWKKLNKKSAIKECYQKKIEQKNVKKKKNENCLLSERLTVYARIFFLFVYKLTHTHTHYFAFNLFWSWPFNFDLDKYTILWPTHDVKYRASFSYFCKKYQWNYTLTRKFYCELLIVMKRSAKKLQNIL